MFETAFHDHSRAKIARMRGEIDRLSESQLTAASTDDLVEQFFAKYGCEMPTLDEGPPQWEQLPQDLHPDRQIFAVRVPFTGNGSMLGFHGNSWPTLNMPAKVEGDAIVFTVSVPKERPQAAVDQVTDTIRHMKSGLGPLSQSVNGHNENIRVIAKQQVEQRRSHFNQHASFLDNMSKLVPIKRREDAAASVVLPVQRKEIPVFAKPTEPKAQAEPQISMQAYEDILSVITSMVHVFERSPATFRTMDEEALRTILLVALNGIYHGRATGETFNGEGKNDILIREADRNVFIAECLVWEGPEYLKGKIDDQLLKRYATWRDSKLAVLVFNRKKDFSSVVAKMKKVCDDHPQRVNTLPFTHESGFRYTFRRADDPQRNMILTALAFNVPTV